MPPISLRRLAMKFALALCAFSLCFGNMIGKLNEPDYRIFNRISSLFRAALVFDVVLLATIAVLVEELLKRLGYSRLHRMWRQLFILVVGSGVLSVTPGVRHRRKAVLILWVLLVVVIVAQYVRGSERVLRLVRSIALVFLPLPLILAATLFRWKPLDPLPLPARAAPSPVARASGAGPVLILLFDEWSYPRSIAAGEFLPELVNLRKLAGESFVFHKAYSTDQFTMQSILAFLFQEAGGFDYKDGRPRFIQEGPGVATATAPSLFQAARDRGFSTSLIGWYLPHEAIFGDQVQSYHDATGWPGKGFAVEAARVACENLYFSEDPLTCLLRRASTQRVHVAQTREIQSTALKLVRECPRDTFAFIHWNIPHPPFRFRANGGVHPLWHQTSTSDYVDQIRYIDILIGQLMDELRDTKKFDDALIVVMSDHGWRQEHKKAFLAAPDENRHVPLVVKWPGQRSSVAVDTRLSLVRLGDLIKLSMDGGNEAAARRVIEELAESEPTPVKLDPGIN